MNPEDTQAGRFYCNFKVHKPHKHKKAPPERPITSQSGTICEGVAEVPTEYIVQMMELLLNNNIFEFDEFHWKQNVGAAIGCKPLPPYANVFMATIGSLIKNQQGAQAFLLLMNFLDDFFTMFKGSTKELHALFVKINLIHSTIKFTINQTSISTVR